MVFNGLVHAHNGFLLELKNALWNVLQVQHIFLNKFWNRNDFNGPFSSKINLKSLSRLTNDVIFHFGWHNKKLRFRSLKYTPITWISPWYHQVLSFVKPMSVSVLTSNHIWVLKVLRWGKQAAPNINDHGLSYFSIVRTSSNVLNVQLLPYARISSNYITDFTMTDFKRFLLLK